jgi:hypothetical protein
MAIIVRKNFNTYEAGEEWISRLDDESQRNFKIILSLLSDYWKSSIDGPLYAREVKAMAISIARLRLSLEDIQIDQSYSTTRTEFLYQILTSSVFPGTDGAPDIEKTDIEFRDFLNQVISVYFNGSIPQSIQKAVELVTGGNIIVRENFLNGRKKDSGYDISDEFGITIDVVLPNPGSINTILAEKNIRILLSIIRPSHTLYNLKFILQDVYLGKRTQSHKGKIGDSSKSILSNYSYEDFRKFTEGVAGLDRKGFKKAVNVTNEDHSNDY